MANLIHVSVLKAITAMVLVGGGFILGAYFQRSSLSSGVISAESSGVPTSPVAVPSHLTDSPNSRVSNAKVKTSEVSRLAELKKNLITALEQDQLEQAIALLRDVDLSIINNKDLVSRINFKLEQFVKTKNWSSLDQWLYALKAGGINVPKLANFEAELLVAEGLLSAAADLLYGLMSNSDDWAELNSIQLRIRYLVSDTLDQYERGQFKSLTVEKLLQLVAEKQPEYTPFIVELARFQGSHGRPKQALQTIDSLAPGAGNPELILRLRRQWQLEKAAQEHGVRSIPMARYGSHFVVDAMINGVSNFRLMLDTGASLTVLSPQAFARLYQSSSIGSSIPLTVNTANGATIVDSYRVQDVSVGRFYQTGLQVAVADLGDMDYAEGLLGMDFLKHYRFEIDQVRGKLVLEDR